MWTKLPPDFKSVDNQLDMCLLVAMYPYLGERVPPGETAPPPQMRMRPPQASSLYNVIQHTFILNLCTCFLHLLYNVYICDLKSFFKINLRTLWNFTILFS